MSCGRLFDRCSIRELPPEDFPASGNRIHRVLGGTMGPARALKDVVGDSDT